MPYVGKKPADIIATAIDTTTGTFSGEIDAASLDISGNIDVDGTTNLDVVDIDGAVNMATTLLVTGETTLQTHLNMGDNDIIKLGAGNDFELFSDGSNGVLKAPNLDLYLQSDSKIRLTSEGNSETLAIFNKDGAVDLYHDNSKKLSTTAGGTTIFDQELKVTSATGDNADKTGAFTTGHYDTDEENVAGVIVNCANGDNIVNIGGAFNAYNAATKIRFFTSANATTVSGTERARFLPTGEMLVGGLTSSNSSGESLQVYDNGSPALSVGRQQDGTIVHFRVGSVNGAAHGSIDISGVTCSYNAFSGSHWSRLSDNSKPTILKGTIIETIDEMCDWYQVEFTVPATDEEDEYTMSEPIGLPSGKSVGDTITHTYEGTDYTATITKEGDEKHVKCKISDTEDSKKVYGVHRSWDNDDDTVNDMYVTAVGTHVVRINKDVTVQAGDLLSSNGDGTAKVQDDDIIRSKTIGKVLTNIKQETYDDGSYTVPCALYCG